MGRLARESIRPYVGWIVAAVLCMALVAAATGASAWLMEPIINKVFVEKNKALLWPIGGAILVTFLIKGLANYGQSVLMQQVGLRVVTTLQSQMFDRIVAADLAFMQSDATGKLISRFTNDVNYLRNAVIKTVTGSV